MPANDEQYWEERAIRFAHEGAGLKAVCSFGMPKFYNWAIHQTQLRALYSYLRPDKKSTVLDVGCGVGRWSLRMAPHAKQVTGLDVSETMLKQARRLRGNLPATFTRASIAETQLNEKYDFILCVTVLQHMDDGEATQALKNMRSMLSKGGKIVVLEVAPMSLDSACDTGVFECRTSNDYQRMFSASKLRSVATHGVDVVPFKQALLPGYQQLPSWLAVPLINLTAAIALPLDLIFAKQYPHRSWHCVFELMAAEDD